MKNTFACLLVLIALAGCQVEPDAALGHPGTVTIALQGPEGRAVVADFPGLTTSYFFELTSKSGWATLSQTGTTPTATFVGVGTGNWDIRVTAYSGATILGAGQLLNKNLWSGSAGSTLVVPLTSSQTGSGGYAFTFSVPVSTGIDAVAAQLFDPSDNPVGAVQDVPLVSDGTRSTGTAAGVVASGAYRLQLTFRRGAAVAGIWSEAVNVWDNLTSDRWLSPAGALLSSRDFASTEFSSSGATLSALQLYGQANVGLTPAFSSDQTAYAALSGAASVKVMATGSMTGQKLEYRLNGGTWTPMTSAAWVSSLTVGTGLSVEVRVTATDHLTQKVYTLTLGPGTLTYHGNGNDGGTVPTSGLYDTGIVVSIPTYSPPTRAGYTLTGWTTGSDGSGVTYPVGGSLTMGLAPVDLWAKWTPNPYRVFLYPNGAPGTMMPTQSVGYQTSQPLPAVTYSYAGYTFAGWATSSGGPAVYSDQGAYTQTQLNDVNLFAVWTKIDYHIRYHANGGTGTMADTLTTLYTSPKASPNTFGSAGSHFIGWSLGASTRPVYADQASVWVTLSDVDLYAQWVDDLFTTTTDQITSTSAQVNLAGVSGSVPASLAVPAPITATKSWALSGQTGLTTVTFADSLTSLGSWTFDGCTNLTAVNLGSSVTAIGQEAFRKCSSLAAVTLGTATPPALTDPASYPAFGGCPAGFVIRVPSAALTAYLGAPGWSNWASHLVGY